MSKEEKAKLAYDKNKKKPKKYQIEDSFWTDWYCKGYTQAEQDISTQLTAYKEALREIIEAFSYIVPNYEANHVSGLYNAIYNTDILIKEKAKTLIE